MSKEPIHSGHFMTSNPHTEIQVEDEDENVEVDVVEVDDSTSNQINEKHSVQDRDEKPVTFYKFGPQKTQSIAIDVSLNKLNKCIKIAYMKMTTPKWKDFKGLKLGWKQRIRLNNVIWRAYYIEFRKPGKKKKITSCYFAVPDDDTTHAKIEGSIMEGMYWKRRMEAVCAQYKRWRTYNRHAKKKLRGCCRKRENSCICELSAQINMPPQSQTPQSMSTINDFFNIDDDFDNEFTNSFFDSLNAPFLFPNLKENIQCVNADIMQPGLLSLQPSIKEIMSNDYLFNENSGKENTASTIDQVSQESELSTNQPIMSLQSSSNSKTSFLMESFPKKYMTQTSVPELENTVFYRNGLYLPKEYDGTKNYIRLNQSSEKNVNFYQQRRSLLQNKNLEDNLSTQLPLINAHTSQPLYSQAFYSVSHNNELGLMRNSDYTTDAYCEAGEILNTNQQQRITTINNLNNVMSPIRKTVNKSSTINLVPNSSTQTNNIINFPLRNVLNQNHNSSQQQVSQISAVKMSTTSQNNAFLSSQIQTTTPILTTLNQYVPHIIAAAVASASFSTMSTINSTIFTATNTTKTSKISPQQLISNQHYSQCWLNSSPQSQTQYLPNQQTNLVLQQPVSQIQFQPKQFKEKQKKLQFVQHSIPSNTQPLSQNFTAQSLAGENFSKTMDLQLQNLPIFQPLSISSSESSFITLLQNAQQQQVFLQPEEIEKSKCFFNKSINFLNSQQLSPNGLEEQIQGVNASRANSASNISLSNVLSTTSSFLNSSNNDILVFTSLGSFVKQQQQNLNFNINSLSSNINNQKNITNVQSCTYNSSLRNKAISSDSATILQFHQQCQQQQCLNQPHINSPASHLTSRDLTSNLSTITELQQTDLQQQKSFLNLNNQNSTLEQKNQTSQLRQINTDLPQSILNSKKKKNQRSTLFKKLSKNINLLSNISSSNSLYCSQNNSIQPSFKNARPSNINNDCNLNLEVEDISTRNNENFTAFNVPQNLYSSYNTLNTSHRSSPSVFASYVNVHEPEQTSQQILFSDTSSHDSNLKTNFNQPSLSYAPEFSLQNVPVRQRWLSPLNIRSKIPQENIEINKENFSLPVTLSSPQTQCMLYQKMQQEDEVPIEYTALNSVDINNRQLSSPSLQTNLNQPHLTLLNDRSSIISDNEKQFIQLNSTNSDDFFIPSTSKNVFNESNTSASTVKEELSIKSPLEMQKYDSAHKKILNLIPSGSKRRNALSNVVTLGSLSAPADSTLHPEERKRILHLYAEKNRRNALKEGFDALIDLIPIVEQTGVKITNAVVLNCAAQHLRNLIEKNNEKKNRIQLLKDKIAQMNDKIASIQSNLPSNSQNSKANSSLFAGSNNTLTIKTQIMQFFERYKKEQSKKDYRFWVMSEILAPIVESYAENIHPNPLERKKISETAQRWLDQYWNAAVLRPIASETLVRFATASDLFFEDSALPKYILNEIAKFS